MKKRIVIILCIMFLLTGCGVRKIEVNNPRTEEEIISFVKKKIYLETNDDVDVTIISKEDLVVCTESFDGCLKYQKVENGYSYELEIKDTKNKKILGTGIYKDGYVMYDKKYENDYEKEKWEISYELNIYYLGHTKVYFDK